ncbi:hypothetical protein Tco_0849913 [Tanacetum coccineum]
MENEHEMSYETLTRVYLGSYEHYKSVGAEVEHPEPGFELQGAKMIEEVDGVVACRGYFGQKGGDAAQFGAKEGKIFVVAAE